MDMPVEDLDAKVGVKVEQYAWYARLPTTTRPTTFTYFIPSVFSYLLYTSGVPGTTSIVLSIYRR